MGTIATIVVGLAIIIVGVVILVPLLANLEDLKEGGVFCALFPTLCIATEDTEKFKEEVEKQETEAEARLPTGGQLCDLSVFVDAQLVDEFGFLKIKIDESDPANYQWHCKFPSPLDWLSSLQFTPLAFFLENEFIHAEIVLIDKDNPSKKYDANHPNYKSMYREIRLTDTTGFVATPLNMDQTFYIQDIVHDDYVLEIYYGRIINNLDAGEPLVDKVCMVGKSSC